MGVPGGRHLNYRDLQLLLGGLEADAGAGPGKNHQYLLGWGPQRLQDAHLRKREQIRSLR